MGFRLFSKCTDDDRVVRVPRPQAKGDGNPNKYRYTVIRSERVGAGVVAVVHYPDCTNFHGNKILVYEDGEAFDAIWKRADGEPQGPIDPHFLEEGMSPIARFEPTTRGWEMAQRFARMHFGGS